VLNLDTQLWFPKQTELLIVGVYVCVECVGMKVLEIRKPRN